MMNWTSIESAPKDGTALLLCRATGADGSPITGSAWGLFVQVAAWWENDGNDGNDEGGDWVVYCSMPQEPLLHFEPTHWMPLPANPLMAGVALGEE